MRLQSCRTKTKQYYEIRNREICIKYKNGVPVKILADMYSLVKNVSIHGIWHFMKG